MISDFPPQYTSSVLGGLKHMDFAASIEMFQVLLSLPLCPTVWLP